MLDQDSNAASIFFLQQWGNEGSVVACGRFNGVNGHERWGSCVLDSSGEVLPPFENCRIDSTISNSLIYCSILGLAFTPDSQYVYVHGSYNGFSDGVVNDTAQAFISRLHVGDITMAVPAQSTASLLIIAPNPTSGNATLTLEQLPQHAAIVVRDALGREVHRQGISDHCTTLSLAHSGVYVVELWSGDTRISTHRVVVE
ncbi:MAG: T9SS type A sorting domain-containing protein [Flavobacteriales bacterium]|nr:T9SS type A sorting domain-containing protein [Flavobacteriales bacterium]